MAIPDYLIPKPNSPAKWKLRASIEALLVSFLQPMKEKNMDFRIAFLNLPVSKDDSFIGLPSAELVHATVSSAHAQQAKQYVIEPIADDWKQNLGTIELARTSDNHWQLIRGKETVEGIFPRIIQAIEDVESQLENQSTDLSQ